MFDPHTALEGNRLLPSAANRGTTFDQRWFQGYQRISWAGYNVQAWSLFGSLDARGQRGHARGWIIGIRSVGRKLGGRTLWGTSADLLGAAGIAGFIPEPGSFRARIRVRRPQISRRATFTWFIGLDGAVSRVPRRVRAAASGPRLATDEHRALLWFNPRACRPGITSRYHWTHSDVW